MLEPRQGKVKDDTLQFKTARRAPPGVHARTAARGSSRTAGDFAAAVDARTLGTSLYARGRDAFALGTAKHRHDGHPDGREFNLQIHTVHEVLGAYHRRVDLRTVRPGPSMFGKYGPVCKAAAAAGYPLPSKTHSRSIRLFEGLEPFLESVAKKEREIAIRKAAITCAIVLIFVGLAAAAWRFFSLAR